jgi:hypothetical protein
MISYCKKFESNKIGKFAEEIFEKALRELKLEGRIKSFLRKNDYGVDYLLSTDKISDVAIQVKSSKKRAIYHLFKHPEIPVVWIKYQKNLTPREKRKTIQNTKLNIVEIVRNSCLK